MLSNFPNFLNLLREFSVSHLSLFSFQFSVKKGTRGTRETEETTTKLSIKILSVVPAVSAVSALTLIASNLADTIFFARIRNIVCNNVVYL